MDIFCSANASLEMREVDGERAKDKRCSTQAVSYAMRGRMQI